MGEKMMTLFQVCALYVAAFLAASVWILAVFLCLLEVSRWSMKKPMKILLIGLMIILAVGAVTASLPGESTTTKTNVDD